MQSTIFPTDEEFFAKVINWPLENVESYFNELRDTWGDLIAEYELNAMWATISRQGR